MGNIIEKHFNTLKHLRESKGYLKDINALSLVLDNYENNPNSAILLLAKLTKKYEDIINKVGELLNGITVVHQVGIYADKSDEDIMFDIEYLIDCIIIEASLRLKLEPSIETLINKIKKENK